MTLGAPTKSLLEKLGVKPDARVSVLGAFDEDFLGELGVRAARVRTSLDGEAEIIFLRASVMKDLARLDAIRKRMKRDAAVWVVRPKGKDGLAEAAVLGRGLDVGLVDVKVVAFSTTHTAHKFVIRLKDR